MAKKQVIRFKNITPDSLAFQAGEIGFQAVPGGIIEVPEALRKYVNKHKFKEMKEVK